MIGPRSETGHGPDGPAPAPRSPWLVGRPVTPLPARHLYCFPHSGGMAGEYISLGRHLPGTQVYGIGLPGRAGRSAEAHVTDMHKLVDDLLGTTRFTPPYVLFGHSLGALVAFEVTRGLVARGLPLPERLVVSACSAPSLPRSAPVLHDKPADELVRALRSRYGGIPQQVAENRELLEIFLPALRADLALLETYEYGTTAQVPVPVEVFGGDTDVVTSEQLQPWSLHSSVATRMHSFRGGHFYFRDDPEPVLATLNAHELWSPHAER